MPPALLEVADFVATATRHTFAFSCSKPMATERNRSIISAFRATTRCPDQPGWLRTPRGIHLRASQVVPERWPIRDPPHGLGFWKLWSARVVVGPGRAQAGRSASI